MPSAEQVGRQGSRRERAQWGLLPNDVAELLQRREWENTKNLKARLKGEKPFPIQVSLRPPRGSAALEDINKFQLFVSSWKEFAKHDDFRSHAQEERDAQGAQSCGLCWERRGYRYLSEQMVPVRILIHTITALARIVGKSAEHQLNVWHSKISYIISSLAIKENREPFLRSALIDHLDALAALNDSDMELMVKLIPQLRRGMGEGCYLRALPVMHVDTKFIEGNVRIIEAIVAAVLDGAVKDIGLLAWLHCRDKPKDWLLVKPLCEQSRAALGGMPILRLSSDTLLKYELPADKILIIENEQACLSLPEIPGTIAVAGGGKNVAWMRAAWLAGKRVAYWGDIDSEGLCILSDARSKLSSLTPLMMNAATVDAHRERMVQEPDSIAKEPPALNEEELFLFRMLRSEKRRSRRLEQERLSPNFVKTAISQWAKNTEA
ncbi:MAG: Wadjet anti-phage system protein JetD domain-containing protein [Salinispira sp.]